jgi:hypothetical protein
MRDDDLIPEDSSNDDPEDNPDPFRNHPIHKADPAFGGKFTVDANDCWIWNGLFDGVGYGRLAYGGKSWSAHRLSFRLHKHQIPEGVCVLHRCDIRACINPNHLFLGSKKDNSDDKIAKGRQKKGEQVKSHKLSDEQVKRIKESPNIHGITSILSNRYGVSRSIISYIRRGERRH